MQVSPKILKQLDPDGGYILMSSFWRPNPNDPDPEMPGLKQQLTTFQTG